MSVHMDTVCTSQFASSRELLPVVFFFQAEDGIRDYKVPGVQTCALPILASGLGTGPDAAHGARREIEVPRLAQGSVCGGSGAQPGSQRKTCKTCYGRGQVQQVRRSGFAQMIQITTCPRCNGAGTVVDKPCKNCGGNGLTRERTKLQVKVPAGADEGQSLRLRGEGNAALGGRAGDLYIRIHLKPHPSFKREGDNVLYETKISIPKAALGGEL